MEIVILSKNESKILDGDKDKEFELDGKKTYGRGLKTKGTPQERLNSIDAKIDKRYENNILC